MRRLLTVVVAGVTFLFSGWFVGTGTGVARAEEALKKAKINKDDKAKKIEKMDNDKAKIEKLDNEYKAKSKEVIDKGGKM
jgi:hypothetical protein